MLNDNDTIIHLDNSPGIFYYNEPGAFEALAWEGYNPSVLTVGKARMWIEKDVNGRFFDKRPLEDQLLRMPKGHRAHQCCYCGHSLKDHDHEEDIGSHCGQCD